MRILLTSPYSHPHVRRGSERYIKELGCWLRRHGHDVSLFTTGPADDQIIDECGVRVTFRTTGRPFGRGRLHVDPPLRAGFTIARELGRQRQGFDVAETHHLGDAAAVALRARRLPFVLWLPGVARPESFGGRPLYRAALRIGARRAGRIHSISEFARNALARNFGLASEVVYPGVDTRLYDGPKPTDQPPIVLCTAAAEDARKNVALLVRAFGRISESSPDVRLVLAPHDAGPAQRLLEQLEPAAAARAEVRAGLSVSELAELYRAAAVTALPSVDEAFGLVLVESLAAGTPVVGSDHGAIPEIISDADIGRLFPPDDEDGLVAALTDVIERSTTDRDLPRRCRAWARQWDWDAIGPLVEKSYESIAG